MVLHYIVNKSQGKYAVFVQNIQNNGIIKNVGSFEIDFVNVQQNGINRRIPSMSINVNNYYQRQGIAKQMIKTLIESLNLNERKRLGILYINTNASPINNKQISVWNKLGLRPNRSFGYQKSVLLNELYNRVR